MAGSSFALSEQAGLTLHGLCPRCQDRALAPQLKPSSAFSTTSGSAG